MKVYHQAIIIIILTVLLTIMSSLFVCTISPISTFSLNSLYKYIQKEIIEEWNKK